MAVGDIKTYDIVYNGLVLQINAIDMGDGTVTFEVSCVEGYCDLNAVYWSDGDNKAGEGTMTGFNAKSDSSLNMNGSGEAWDGGLKLSSAGLGPDGINKSTYLTAGETYVFTGTLDFATLDTLGVRATSTSTAGGSIKGVDGEAVVTDCPDISVNDVTVAEEDGNAVFTVRLDKPYLYDVIITYETADGSAGSSDYTAKTGSITIKAGETSATVSVPILDDSNPESTETFTLKLTSATVDIPDVPGGPTTLAINGCIVDGEGVGTILDTDTDTPPPPPPNDHFADNGHALSYATFYFGTPNGDVNGMPNGEPLTGPVPKGTDRNPPDGVYTVKIEFEGSGAGNDLDGYYDAILDWLIVNDPNVSADTPVLGVAIHAGNATTETFYAIDNNPNDVDDVPSPPGDLATDSEVDQVYSYHDDVLSLA
jgi:hypothetical protein